MNNTDIKVPTEGEEFVMDFFKELGIKYEAEKKIVGLKGDNKQYRIADFYLPKFNAYVEFYGLWNKNVKDKDEDYKNKKEIYRNNGIPCVYLYPENFGVLAFSFDKRIQKTLAENGKYVELKKYRWFKFYKARSMNFFVLLFGFFFLYLSVGSNYSDDSNGFSRLLVSFAIITYQGYRLAAYVDIFIRNKFSLSKVLDR